MSRIFRTPLAAVYPLYVTKVERKGRTKAELDEVVEWLGHESATTGEGLRGVPRTPKRAREDHIDADPGEALWELVGLTAADLVERHVETSEEARAVPRGPAVTDEIQHGAHRGPAAPACVRSA